MAEPVDVEKHRAEHERLFRALDELVRDFVWHTDRSPQHTTIFELIMWSYEQAVKPTGQDNQARGLCYTKSLSRN